jgi:hypothetical protein
VPQGEQTRAAAEPRDRAYLFKSNCLLCESALGRNQPLRDRSAACPSRDAAPRHHRCRGRGPDPGGERLHHRWSSATAHSRRRARPLRDCCARGGGAVDVLFGGRLQDCAIAARRHGRRVDHPGCQAGQSCSLGALAHRSVCPPALEGGARSPRITPRDRVCCAAFGAGNGVGKAEAGRR